MPGITNALIDKYNIYAAENGYKLLKNRDYWGSVINCTVVDLMPSSLGKYGEYQAMYNIIMEQGIFFKTLART